MDTIPIIEITESNLDSQHICCAIGNTPDAKQCSAAKKAWMLAAFKDGYRMHRLDAQGKALIETTPAKNAWCPILAENWLFIDCFWISGKFKGQGYAKQLLRQAVARAREEGFAGLAALAGSKKTPFLSDGGFYKHFGFTVADSVAPYYELLALPLADVPADIFEEKSLKNTKSTQYTLPKLNHNVIKTNINSTGIVVYYSQHCPHTGKYLPLLQQVAQRHAVPFEGRLLQTAAQAQAAPCPFTTWAMYMGGSFLTNEIYSPAKLDKLLDAMQK